MKNTELQTGDAVVLDDGREVELDSLSKGWWAAYTLDDGKLIKVRGKQVVRFVGDDDEDEITGEYSPDLDENGNEIPLDDDGEPDEDEEGGTRTMASQLAKAREHYVEVVSYTGKKSAANGDDLAVLLSGSHPLDVIAAAEVVCELKPGELKAKYEGLNPGQQRMNAGNRIRGAVKRGEATIDEVAEALGDAGTEESE